MKLIKTEEAVGHVLCHDMTQIIKGVTKDARFRKGHIVTEEDIPVLLSMGKENLYVWEKNENMLHEDEAAEILREICQGEHMHASQPKEGKIELTSDIDGILTINVEKLLAVNSLGEMMIATRHSYTPVKKGAKLAATRIIPLIIEKEKMEAAKRCAGKEPLINVLPYKLKTAALITTGGEVAKGLIRDTFSDVVIGKLKAYGIETVEHCYPGDDEALITEKIAEYKAKASGITVSTHAISKLNPLGLGYVPTIPVKGKAGSTTYAAIADSIITTTKEKTDKEIRHNTENALNKLSEIFDKKKIEEKQEYVNILSQVGYRLIGDIAGHKENELNKKAEKARKENNSILAEKYEREAKKWSESGTNRIAMHGIMGALVSKEAGAGMTKGLTGAGLNALLQKELGKIKAPEVHKMASAAIGYLAGGKTGTAIAHQATTFNYLTHEQYKQYLDDMKNAKTEEEKKRLQKDWEAIDERQRYSPISTPGTYWDLKTGRPFTVKEGGSLFEPVLVTATRAHGETLFESAMASAINTKVAKYLGRETVIGDALTLPWDIAKDADINKYGIQGAKRRIGIDIYGNLMVVGTTVFTGGTFGGILKGLGVSIAIEEIKEYGAPSLTVQERENADNEYIEKINREMD